MIENNSKLSESQSTFGDQTLGADWQVPEFSTQVLASRRHKYCVVIPVINEGERIGRLLNRMTTLEIQNVADIIIVDGGSTDGSLDSRLLNKAGVCALLTKTGPGKLSAQLRCAYAYALRQRYEGIVTIDGNDKDDPDAIPRLINALRDGTDFVQASRFVEGGGEENTPRLRRLAIRWLHAPLLSWSSGFRWTDTTQGYRAYRSRMLLDPRLAPFRDVFNAYELLAYLSHRVPRLGYVCQELPAIRRYPATGKTPTQISAVRGNLGVLQNLFKAALGAYDPVARAKPENRRPHAAEKWNHAGNLLCVLAVFVLFYVGLFSPKFSPDSWSYLELSDSVFSDFYRVSTIRQFEYTAPYSTSFPPLWPVSIALMRQVVDVGIYSGCLLNAIICLTIFPVILTLARRLDIPAWVGRSVFLVLIAFPPFFGELLSARSIPLSVLLIGSMLALFLKPAMITSRRAALLGVLAGLACLNRFDFLFGALGIGLLLPLYAGDRQPDGKRRSLMDSHLRHRGASVWVTYYALLLVTLSPWVVYCYSHFGTPLASDNARQVYLATQTHVRNFFAMNDSSPTLWTAPLTWFVGLVTTKLPSISRIGMILIVAVPCLFAYKVRRGFSGAADRRLWVFAVSVGALTAIPVMLVGYGDSRYFVPHFLFVSLLVAMLVKGEWVFPRWSRSTRVGIQFAAMVLVLCQIKPSLEQLNTRPKLDLQIAAAEQFQGVVGVLERDSIDYPQRPRVLIGSGAEGCQFGAISKIDSVLTPFNLDSEVFPEFVAKFGITHLLDPDSTLLPNVGDGLSVEPTDLTGLYRIKVAKTGATEATRIGQRSANPRR